MLMNGKEVPNELIMFWNGKSEGMIGYWVEMLMSKNGNG